MNISRASTYLVSSPILSDGVSSSGKTAGAGGKESATETGQLGQTRTGSTNAGQTAATRSSWQDGAFNFPEIAKQVPLPLGLGVESMVDESSFTDLATASALEDSSPIDLDEGAGQAENAENHDLEEDDSQIEDPPSPPGLADSEPKPKEALGLDHVPHVNFEDFLAMDFDA
ncbi:MAG: hypothetical protein LBT98_00030 [Puniceicoccales bacterium]|jgi:hypothetical protein|nr:hypothetical protein [Puniceicoccales bacterium]